MGKVTLAVPTAAAITPATDTENRIIDPEKCIGCGACAEACLTSAISMVPKELSPQQPKEEKVVKALRGLVQSEF